MKIGDIALNPGAALAPMAGVTNAVTRVLSARFGCAWSVSEMLSAKGYLLSPQNRAGLEVLARMPGEGTAGLQLFGREPDVLAEAARRLEDRDFAFFDFNMGCPAPKIVKNGEGSWLMREPALAGKLVRALVGATKKPVSVKIRAGWDENSINAVEIARIAEDAGACMIVVHPRTRTQQYAGEADWRVIARVKEAVKIPVVGNGDVRSGADAKRMLCETGCDNVMIGRAARGNPWIFEEVAGALSGRAYAPPDARTRVNMALEHLRMQCAWKGEEFAVVEMRALIACYLSGLTGGGKLRARINQMTTYAEVEDAFLEFTDRRECK